MVIHCSISRRFQFRCGRRLLILLVGPSNKRTMEAQKKYTASGCIRMAFGALCQISSEFNKDGTYVRGGLSAFGF